MEQDEQKEIKQPSSEPKEDRRIEFSQGAGEKKEMTSEALHEKARIREILMQEIEMMEQDESLKTEAEDRAKKLDVLGENDKIENLLEAARTKGVIFAVGVAKKMNDPFILDILHDVLAREGYFKKYTL